MFDKHQRTHIILSWIYRPIAHSHNVTELRIDLLTIKHTDKANTAGKKTHRKRLFKIWISRFARYVYLYIQYNNNLHDWSSCWFCRMRSDAITSSIYSQISLIQYTHYSHATMFTSLYICVSAFFVYLSALPELTFLQSFFLLLFERIDRIDIFRLFTSLFTSLFLFSFSPISSPENIGEAEHMKPFRMYVLWRRTLDSSSSIIIIIIVGVRSFAHTNKTVLACYALPCHVGISIYFLTFYHFLHLRLCT